MPLFYPKCLGIAVLGASLAGCAGGFNSYMQPAPGHPVSDQALADEVYLDGTGPSARRTAIAPSYSAAERIAAEPQTSGVTKPVVRTRPTAIPQDRAEDISARNTTGVRNSAKDEKNKAFSDEWLEKERQEDARLRAKMNICRGC